MKNISTLVLLTVSSLALTGCGGNNQNSSAKDASAILKGQSIADGLIRPEVKTLTKESFQKIMSQPDETKQQEIMLGVIPQYQSFLNTSTNQLERDLLQLDVNSFGRLVEANKITDESDRRKATKKAFAENLSESKLFWEKYIQSTQLRSLIVGFYSLAIERED